VCNFAALALSNAGDRPLAILRANHASTTSPVYGKPFIRAVTLMADLDLLTVEVGYRHGASRWSRAPSTISRTPEFTLPVVADWHAFSLEDHERLIVLNTDNEEGKRKQRPSAPPPNAERDMFAINTHLRMAHVEVNAEVHIAGWSSTIADHLMTPHHRQLRRVFSGNYEQGGRLYDGWWQTLPREQRTHIRIDGSAAGGRARLEPVVNVDFSAMHLRLAYAEAGCEPPPGDLYDLTGSDHLRPDWQTLREGRKKLVSVMFTSKRPLRQWPGGTPRECEEIRACFVKGAKIKDEVGAIREGHQAIAGWFECGRGMRLQRTESDILVPVLLKLNALGITALPIHDSVLVARSRGESAQRIMEAEALKVTGEKIPAKVSEV
jgi:hypothetical protein